MIETVYEELPRKGRYRGRRAVLDVHHPESSCLLRARIPGEHLKQGEVEHPADTLTVLDTNRQFRELRACNECLALSIPLNPYQRLR